MKLKELRLRGFRSHTDTHIKGLSRFNIFLGANGAGKSTIMDGLSYLLTGVCRGTDEGGRGSDILATAGHNAKTITSIEGTGENGTLGRGLKQGPRSQLQQQIRDTLKIDDAMLRVVLQPDNFITMEPKLQKNLLVSVMSRKLSVPEVRKALGDEIADLFPGLEVLTEVEGMNHWEAQLRTRRPVLKRQIADMTYKAPELPPIPEGDPAEILEAAQEQIRGLRRERDKALSENAASRGAMSLYQSRKKDLEDRIAAAHKREVADPEKVKEKLEKLKDEWAEASDKEKKANKTLEDISQTNRELVQRLEGQKQMILDITSLEGKCHTCHRSLTDSEKKTVLADIKRGMVLTERDLKKSNKALEKASARTLGKSADDIKSDIEALERVLVELDGLAEIIEQDEALLASLEKPKPMAIANTEELEKRIAKGEELMSRLRLHISEAGKGDEIKARRAKLERELELTEEAIKLMSHDGELRKSLVGGGLDTFLKEVNALAEICGLPEVNITMEPWRILYGGLPAVMASASEKYRLNMVFAGVFAKRSGAGLLCLDGADILDAQNRSMLPQVLDTCGLEQAFIGCTSDDPKGHDIEGWSFYEVTMNDGVSTVTKL